jgi:hypothetical protein
MMMLLIICFCTALVLLQTGDLQGLSEETAAWLRTNVAAGRPDLPQLCHDLVSSDHQTSATVFVCGPVRASERVMWLCANRARNPSATACYSLRLCRGQTAVRLAD